jgi:signal transduction histidine kinase/putative methionine-R-sulfoxide reductase with GAF domain
MTDARPESTSAAERDGSANTVAADDLASRLRIAELKLRGIQEISQLLTSSRKLSDIFDEIIHRTTELMACERATFYRLDRELGALFADISSTNDPAREEIRLGDGLIGAAALEGREINIKDAHRDARFDAERDRRLGRRTTSLLCVPVRNGRGDIIGVLQAANKRDGYFTPDDAAMLNAIASQSAIVLNNYELFMEVLEKNIEMAETQSHLEARRAEIELLLEVEHAAAIARSLDEALPGILEAVIRRYPMGLAAVFLLNPANTGVELHASAGSWTIAPPNDGRRLTLPRTLPWIGALLSDQPRPAGADLDMAMRNSPLGECLVTDETLHGAWDFPIRRGGDAPIGALLILNCPASYPPLPNAPHPPMAPHHGMQQARRILEAVADRIALAATLARALDEERKAERLAAIGTALSGVVHDLRTPLTVIAGYARSMEREDERERRSAQREVIKRQLDTIQAMIGEVLDFASGRSEVLLRRVFVRDLATELEQTFAEDLASRGIKFSVETIYKGAVKADPRKLMRVFANLVKNAREAVETMPANAEREPSIAITMESDGERVYVHVRDSGPGFPPELEGRLFESFATHGKGHGTGLGLAMARKIIDEHGGTLSASSPPTGGALITIALSPA